MKRRRIPAFILACLLAAGAAASAQSRGNGRIEGKVEDDQGQPAEGVVIRALMKGQTDVVQAKTNNKGEWRLNNLGAGDWTIEFLQEGFEPNRIEVTLGPNERKPPITVALARPVDPTVEIQNEAKKAMELAQGGKFAEARQIYEALLAKYPTIQIHPFIARTYAAEKNYEKAIEHAKMGLASEPDSVDTKLLLADVYMEKGDKEEAYKMLDTVDITKAPDAVSFINASITLINDKKAAEAIAILDKVIAQWPQQAEAYYYRGRAYIAGEKMAEAKADFEKFVSMARPDSPQLEDAKKLLEQLKDVK
ncbi:MAG TPA: tetratricopeptide repeat protein [Vicinamibacterales bacterium]|nr:tetratricopeptide repeat protein [Vicinamibacterales bacterium]